MKRTADRSISTPGSPACSTAPRRALRRRAAFVVSNSPASRATTTPPGPASTSSIPRFGIAPSPTTPDAYLYPRPGLPNVQPPVRLARRHRVHVHVAAADLDGVHRHRFGGRRAGPHVEPGTVQPALERAALHLTLAERDVGVRALVVDRVEVAVVGVDQGDLRTGHGRRDHL